MANEGQQPNTGGDQTANNAPAGTLRITADATLKIPAVPAEPAKPTGEAPNQPAPQGQPNATENQAGEPGTQPTAENRGVEEPGRPLGTNQPPSAEATGGEPGDENQPGQQKNPEETNKPEAGKEGQPVAEHNQQPQGGTEGQPAKQPGQKPPSAEATGGKPPSAESTGGKSPSAETPGGKPLNEKPATVQPGGGGAKQGEPPAKKPERTGRRVRNPLNDFRRGQQLGLRSLLSRRGLNREITKKALGFLLKNPYVLAGVMAVLIIGVVIVVSIAIFSAPTGSSAQLGPNPVTDRPLILTILAKTSNNIRAKQKLMREQGPQILAALQNEANAERDPKNKAIIQQYHDVLDRVIPKVLKGVDFTTDLEGEDLKDKNDLIKVALAYEAIPRIGQKIADQVKAQIGKATLAACPIVKPITEGRLDPGNGCASVAGSAVKAVLPNAYASADVPDTWDKNKAIRYIFSPPNTPGKTVDTVADDRTITLADIQLGDYVVFGDGNPEGKRGPYHAVIYIGPYQGDDHLYDHQKQKPDGHIVNYKQALVSNSTNFLVVTVWDLNHPPIKSHQYILGVIRFSELNK